MIKSLRKWFILQTLKILLNLVILVKKKNAFAQFFWLEPPRLSLGFPASFCIRAIGWGNVVRKPHPQCPTQQAAWHRSPGSGTANFWRNEVNWTIPHMVWVQRCSLEVWELTLRDRFQTFTDHNHKFWIIQTKYDSYDHHWSIRIPIGRHKPPTALIPQTYRTWGWICSSQSSRAERPRFFKTRCAASENRR